MSCDEKENTFDKAEDGECNLWHGFGEENEDKGRINVGLLADKRQNKYFVYRKKRRRSSLAENMMLDEVGKMASL
jgi:hypothetical protein